MPLDQSVDGLFGLGDRQRPPRRDLGGQVGIHGCHRGLIADQAGTPYDRPNQHFVDQTCVKQLGETR